MDAELTDMKGELYWWGCLSSPFIRGDIVKIKIDREREKGKDGGREGRMK